MPYKDPEKRRECRRRWYEKNKSSEKAHIIRRKKEIKKWFNNYKASLRCSICGSAHPAIIDFHHKKGEKKENMVSFMVSNGFSIQKIKEEIQKCQVLCANCHRKIHYKKF